MYEPRPPLFIVIEDTTLSESTQENGMDPLSEDERGGRIIVIPPSPKKTRLVQCHRDTKRDIQSCLREFTENKDVIEASMCNDNQIRFVADLNSEECILLSLASPVHSMTITDTGEADTSTEM